MNPICIGQTINGETVLATISDIPVPIDIVNVFRRPEVAGEAVDEAVTVNAKTVWK